MKRGLPHRVPLSPEALAVLEQVRRLDDDIVFPSAKRDKAGKARDQSVMVFKACHIGLMDPRQRWDHKIHRHH